MKKALWVVLILILACILTLSACDDGNEAQTPSPEHIHAFGEWTTTKKANCTADGTNERYCSCGEKQTQTVGALGHVEVVDAAVAATCTTDGKTEGKYCSRCNETLVAQTAVGKLGHVEVVDVAVAATCTADGKTEGKHCSRCSTVLVSQTVLSSSGHKYNNGKITTQATCNQSGVKTFTCTVNSCRHSYTENYSLPTYTATELYNISVKYVGEIITYDKSGTELALGTGFVISSDGKIVTNYHVIEGAYSADITINNKKYTITTVLAYDENIDLAVVKVNATGLTAATVCKKPVSAGATVYAIGSSRGMTNTYSQGIITYADRVVNGVSHVQHDASITHGNSGGPLINVYGEVIGINTWGISDSQNLNFAVFTAELDNLVYGTPLTMAEFYELNNDALDKLIDYILANGKYDSGNGKTELVLEDGYNSSRTEYHIVQFDYNPKYNCVDLTHFVAFTDSDVTFFTGISIEKKVSSYYWAIFVSVDGSTTNKMSGYINYKTFTGNTLLGYNSYEGKTSQEAATRENASLSAIYLVEYLEWLANNYLGTTISDFGFESFSVSNNGGNSGGDSSYAQYQEELNALTTKYNSDVTELQNKIVDCQTKIENCQKAINNARSQLASLSSTCPQWFLQQYINNWQAYGSTGAATVAAQNAWAQEYNNQCNQLNNTISINTTAISGHQTNIALYNSQIEILTNQYTANVNALKSKYGIA